MPSRYKPRFARYRQRVFDSFNLQNVMHTMNVSMTEVRPGQVKLEFPYQESLVQQHGFIHAGVVSTVLDSACGYAAFSLMPKEAGVLTVEFKVNLLSPAEGEHFIAVGTVKRQGRLISVADGELYARQSGEKKLVASMVGTLMAIYDREGID